VAGPWDFYESLNDFFDAFARPVRGPAGESETEVEVEIDLGEAYTGGLCPVVLDTATGARSYDVDIPAGVTDGQRLRPAGRGAAGRHGDLYLVVRLAPDDRYRVDGRDVTIELPVAPWEAVLGAVVPVDTPAGALRVAVPAGSSSGRRIRLPGHGLPNPHGRPGDLYAEIRVMVPQQLTAAERELFARLAERSAFDPRAA
jgi:curved DNA-binding protein